MCLGLYNVHKYIERLMSTPHTLTYSADEQIEAMKATKQAGA